MNESGLVVRERSEFSLLKWFVRLMLFDSN